MARPRGKSPCRTEKRLGTKAYEKILARRKLYYYMAKKAGLCTVSYCDKTAVQDKAMCKKHLRERREYAEARA